MLGTLWLRLDAQDQALMLRCAIPPRAPRFRRAAWIVITHLGGTGPSILAAGLPWFACCALHEASYLAVATLLVSHVVVQLMKRTVVRGRPAATRGWTNLVREPDRFSFPSGHSAAAMSVAVGYGVAFPVWAAPLFFLAALVGFSRVRLGVHYPSDVLVGQLIAALTAVLLSAFLPVALS